MSAASSAEPTYHDALLLDMRTLTLLLQRNHDQQRRCIYFRRLTMVLSAIRRHPSFEEVNEWTDQLKSMAGLLIDECNGSKDGDMSNSHSRKRRVKEEQWTLEKDGDDAPLKIVSPRDRDILQQLQQMPAIIQRLRTLATRSVPEIISRIAHATSPVLCEISRGYFVQFLTVALACLARINTLLLRMGMDVAIVLQETVPQLRRLCQERQSSMYRKNDIMDWKTLEDLVTPTFLVWTKKDGRRQAKIAASHEWNDLMSNFVEVSHEDLSKQLNECAKENRWKNAMSRFGLERSVSSTNMSGLSGVKSRTNSGDAHGGETDGMFSLHENDAQTFVKNDEPNDEAHNDTGELVNDMHPACDANAPSQFSSGHPVDDNMARIMKRGKEKHPTAMPASESPAPKKKRRKKKKGKSTSAGGTGDCSDAAKPVEGRMASEETAFSNGATPRKEEAALERVELRVAAPTDDLSKPSVVVPPDSDRSEERSTVQAQTKSKKKSSKKSSKKSKKQKRKSSSVIDDIFG